MGRGQQSLKSLKAPVRSPTDLPLFKSIHYVTNRFKVVLPQASIIIDELPDIDLRDETTRMVLVHGYLGTRRDLSKNLSFVPVTRENRRGVQIVSFCDNEEKRIVHEKLKSMKTGSPVAVRGILRTRLTLKAKNEEPDSQAEPGERQTEHQVAKTQEPDSQAESGERQTEHQVAKNQEPASQAEPGEKQMEHQVEVHANNADPKSRATLQKKVLKQLEIALEDIQCFNEFPSDIVMTPNTKFPQSHRHLQFVMEPTLVQALATRDSVASIIRSILSNRNGFLEVETPLLFKSTSEGAREFIVPTRKRNMAYALPQSPQQFKQILMASRIGKYYQFAKCFRDEDLRADRQPEFTQLDLEMSFANGENVIQIVEEVICKVWKRYLDIKLPSAFPRLTYQHAMLGYGSDKPDLRIPISPFTKIDGILPADLISKMTPLSDPLVEAMVVPLKTSPSEARAFIASFLDFADNKHILDNPDGGPGIFVYDSSKPLQGLSAFGFEAVEEIDRSLDLQDGYLIVLQAREKGPLSGGSTPLGKLRRSIHSAAVKQGYLPPKDWNDFRPLWVTDFPLFKPPDFSESGQGGNAGLASTHHPFTSPKTPKDIDLLLTDPTKAVGDHYDLVINGEEIGGGSRRIHHAAMQELIFRDVLKMNDERIAEFSHLLQALRAGCPPHAGIALGFDRLIAMIRSSRDKKERSLRDVIAFPKSSKGEDLMMESPSPMSEEILKTYHLELRD